MADETKCASPYITERRPEAPLQCQNPVEEGEEFCNVCRDHRNAIRGLMEEKAQLKKAAVSGLSAELSMRVTLMAIARRGCGNVRDGLPSCIAHNAIPGQRVTPCSECVAVAALEAHPKTIRPEVLAFARLMEDKLRKNDHKGGWQKESPRYLLERLAEEVEELARVGEPAALAAFIRHAERPDDPQHKSQRADAIGAECADIANFAMMIADNAGALKGPLS